MATRVKYRLIAGAAVGLGVSAAVYYMYRQKKMRDETDEGIGDVDSIISDSEIEDGSLSRNSPVRQYGNGEPVILESVVVDVRTAKNRSNSTTAAPTPSSLIKSDPVEEIEKINDSIVTETQANSELKVLVLGLDNSGKTALIELLTKHRDRDPFKYTPTKGFNVAQTTSDGISFNLMEVGGSTNMRKYWSNFLHKTTLLVYIVDASSHDRFTEAKDELLNVLQNPELADVPCLLLANKQDLKGALPADKIFTEEDIKRFSAKRTLKLTYLDSICIPTQPTVLDFADTILAVILNIIVPNNTK